MPEILAVISDLFFQMRVSAAARAAGRSVRFITSLNDLDTAPIAPLALVDLDARLDVLSAIGRLKDSGCRVVAFGPHVDTASRKAARAAGADRVLAKSKFVTDLPAIVSTVREASPAPSTPP